MCNNKSGNFRKTTILICEAGAIAALYVILTVVLGPLGNAAIQCRVAEALCVLSFFTPAAIPGLAVGCLVANLLSGCLWQDVLFGTLATLLGAIGARLLRRTPWLVPLPTVVFNTAVIPPVLAYCYGAEEGIAFLFLSVGAGEILSAYVLGMILLLALRRRNAHLIKDEQVKK